jgi:hypothetical protein
MKYETKEDILFWLAIIVLAVCIGVSLSFVAEAAGPEITIGEIKQISCTMATEREDGTPLLVNEIMHHEIYITQDQANKGVALIAGLDCLYDLSTTDKEPGQWYIIGVTVDTGGRKSGDSVAAPFYLVTLVALPMPPTSITIQ